MSSLIARVIEALRAKPGQKADALAHSLGADRTEINKLLHGPLKNQVSQDRAYRWSLVAVPPRMAVDAEPHGGFANTDLARLCRYYLACLGYDDTGVSAFLTSKNGDPDYLEVHSLPQSPDDIEASEAMRRMLGRRRSEQGRYGLYFGYPTNVARIRSKKSEWEGYMVEPILLFPIEQDSDGRMTVDLTSPIINQKPFQSFTNVERDMLMNELVQLEQELGIGGDDCRIGVDEIAMRLQDVRPEWPWREKIDPTAFSLSRASITEIAEAGIYNRAVILMADKSPFTQGLEKELRDLASVAENSYRDSVLGRWISGATQVEGMPEFRSPLIEVLPMNYEQRQAVTAALSRPITIITGPPGTGKSQVVTNLLVNAAWAGKRVLFSSKNNKAVDVVEARVNALGPRPFLLRVGAQAYQARLAEYVLSLLSSTATVSDRENFSEVKAKNERLVQEYRCLDQEAERLIELRNLVDSLEQSAEDARRRLGPELFALAPSVDISSFRNAYLDLEAACAFADVSKASALNRLLWPFVRSWRLQSLTRLMQTHNSLFAQIGIDISPVPISDADVSEVRDIIGSIPSHMRDIKKAAKYLNALKALQSNRSLEDIANEEKYILDIIARQSRTLWKLWLRLQPSTLSREDRQKLGKYTSILKMVIDTDERGQISKQIYYKYSEIMQEISYLLPCWAVTSLSVRGRIPFEPGIFDIVVLDEASQCDIASALPLLYRAKAVVIIGDPKQLSHISGLQRGQDQALLEKFDLIDRFPHWAYSHQSLFDLGMSYVSGDDVVNLVDHHRSHADIISFSNNEFYEERLRVATRYDDLKFPGRGEHGIRWVDVKGQVDRPANGGAINNEEAKSVVQTLRDVIINKRYKGSVGVVTPFRAQANAINQLINQDKYLLSELTSREFIADTVHRFQGDERDVIIFSPVLSSDIPKAALSFLRTNGNLFNVAITRARAQLIVVGDLAECASCDIGYLQRFAAYVSSLNGKKVVSIQSVADKLGPSYPNVARPETVSDWERIFYRAAYEAGFALIPQYPIEKYVVDFLFTDRDRRLAIEIDGERYHRNWTGELCRRDQLRNQRLIELGYDVMRFWVYEVRDDIEGCLARLQNWKHQSALDG